MKAPITALQGVDENVGTTFIYNKNVVVSGRRKWRAGVGAPHRVGGVSW
jgi:hypothetical protein